MTFSNPIIPGFNPDPSICRVGDDYYIATSTFQFYPGIPIYHTTEGRFGEWNLIGHVIHTTEHLPELSEAVVRGGLWAPTLRYHNGTFYCMTTFVYADRPVEDTTRWKNFYCTSKDCKEWSKPIYFTYPGYDTSLNVINEKEAWVQGSFYWRIRPEISQFKMDLETGEAKTDLMRIWSGSGKKAPEAPHILKKDDWYYEIISEGGTEEGHSVVMARARSIDAPEAEWEVCPSNPILTHHDLPQERVQCTGHADFFQDGQDQWWMVFLATRHETKESYYTGPLVRETFLTRVVEWPENGWPKIERPIKAVQSKTQGKSQYTFSNGKGQFSLDCLWVGNPDLKRYQLVNDHALKLTGSCIGLDQVPGSPTFIGLRQCDLFDQFSIRLEEGYLHSKVAITIFLDGQHFYSLSVNNNRDVVFTHSFEGKIDSTVYDKDLTYPARLTARSTLTDYVFYFNDEEIASGKHQSVSVGFTGALFGVFAQSENDEEVLVHF
jgi:alpha-N-arabinofuranosidase